MSISNKLMPITCNMRLADVIHLDYLLIPVLERFNISFGFGNKTVQEVCFEKNIDCHFFVEILNSYHNPDYFPQDQLMNFDARLLVDYLGNTHRFYIGSKVPYIESIIEELIANSSKENETNIRLLQQFFNNYKEELKRHLDVEDSGVFPYIMQLEEALRSGEVAQSLYEQVKQNTIEGYADEHSDVEEKLFDLKNLIIKYLPPILRQDICRKLLMELFKLEQDLNNHSRIENTVLVPKVKQLEQQLIKLAEANA